MSQADSVGYESHAEILATPTLRGTQLTFKKNGKINVVNLSAADTTGLHYEIQDAWLVGLSLDRLTLPVRDLRSGDIMPGLGLTVEKVDKLSQGDAPAMIHFTDGSSFMTAGNLEVTVHRRIE